jgi:ATP-dependent Lhr-like helicase
MFHPLIDAWFSDTYGTPTAVQAASWPLIASGEHVLALAPTGSGKTLTAFLTAVSRCAQGVYPAEGLSVLYVSPLKALNEDIRRNLLEPLAAIRARFEEAGVPFPAIRVETRSGDTPQADRRRFLTKPPAILALTPESLAILLLNPRGRAALSTVKYVILDEIHAVLGTKRGAYLSCQIDRLSRVAGEFQRVSLSATVRPPEAAAAFVGGLKPGIEPGVWEGRPVRIVAPPGEKRIDFRVVVPEAPAELTGGPGRGYQGLVDLILERLKSNRTTLVFTDSRRRAERISFLLNERAGRSVAFTHHGSLSKEVRRAVEERLSQGRLPCVVATASLELGIDIGSVDEVILAGSPSETAAALQRVGRSGHGVGMTSTGTLAPFHGLDLLQAAALSGAVADRDIEETRSIDNPLDILAQVILALCAEKPRNIDGLYQLLRGFYVFRSLSRPAYDNVAAMLAGRYETARVRELKPRLYLDAETGELTAPEGTVRLLYASGGVIANRGSYSLRLGGGVKIGEVDEEFVWERRPGDAFSFGSRPWKITAIGPEAVEVVPQERSAAFIPFWKADVRFRSPVLARRTLEVLDGFAQSAALDTLRIPGFSPEAAARLRDFLKAQQDAQGGAGLPGSAVVAVEIVDDPVNRGDAYTVALHTFRGGGVNYPLAMALAQELEDALSLRVEAIPDDNAILLRIPRTAPESPDVLLSRALSALEDCWEARFRSRLESSGVFGAAFREAAERSLLLPRAGFGKRTPLWITRQKAKRLFDAVASRGDFPAIAEAWRVCLQDQFDLDGAARLMDALRDGTVKAVFFRTREPSPFARDMVWKETSVLMYEYDERPELRGGSLSDQAIANALGDERARPRLAAEAAADFTARLRRERPGWTPEDELALAEWVKERIAIPQDEWQSLVRALPLELAERLAADPALGGRIGSIQRSGAALPSLAHREHAPAWRSEPLTLLGQWLRYQGPVSLGRIAAVFGVTLAQAEGAADALAETGDLVTDVRVDGQDKAARIEKLYKAEILHLDGNAYQGKYVITDDLKTNKEGVQRFLQTLHDKEFHNDEIVEPIKISRHDIDKISSFGMRNPDYLKRIAHIPEFIEKSVYIETQNKKRDKYHYPQYLQFVIGAEIDSKEITVRSVFGKGNGVWYYSFYVTDKKIGSIIEELRNPNAVPHTPYRIHDTTLLEILQVNRGETTKITDESVKALVCDRENLDLLLRLARRKARPSIRERPASLLAPYLALRQGISVQRGGGDAQSPAGVLSPAPWDTLLGLAAPAKLWEADFFAARCNGYRGDMLDRAIQEGRLLWYGTGKEKAAFCLPADLELMAAEQSGAGKLTIGGVDLAGGFFDIPRDFWAITDASGLDSDSAARAVWDAAWKGLLTADSWDPVRRGIESGFAPEPLSGADMSDPGGLVMGMSARTGYRRLPKALRDRWKSGRPVLGNWFSLLPPEGAVSLDPLDEEELDRDRVRLLLARWGMLCRPLLEREAGPFGWARLLPVMRRLELAGELVAGRFFAGVNSLQFASPHIAGELEAAEAASGIYWLNAADPANPAGAAVEGLDPRLPARLATTRLCFRGPDLLAVSLRGGRDVRLYLPPEDAALPDALAFLKQPKTRAVRAERKVVIETVNAGPAALSGGYAAALQALGFEPDRGKLILW